MYVCMYVYIYIYIYKFRLSVLALDSSHAAPEAVFLDVYLELPPDPEALKQAQTRRRPVCIDTYVYIYIYIYA